MLAPPSQRSFRSFERQPRVLLRECHLGMVRAAQVFQLVFLGTLIELTRIGKAMQQGRQVPGDSDGAPDSPQRRVAIAVQKLPGTPGVKSLERLRQVEDIRDGEVQSLCTRWWHDVSGITGQKEAAVLHRFGHEAAQRSDGFLN